MTETHLSRIGYQKFVRGLRCNKSSFIHVVPGKHCPFRARSSEAGDFTGVAALSRWPCRALPHSIPPAIYDTSRVQVVGTCIHGLWITIGILYGTPKSTSHLHPKFHTEQHLEALIDRVACQTSGPRILMGDFNWEKSELHQLSRLEDLGFVEVQDLAHSWWGNPVLPTGTGTRRIDYVYISKELVGLFNGVTVDHEQWQDHASVAACFHSLPTDFDRFIWTTPHDTHWPTSSWEFCYQPLSEENPTVRYADLWNQVEQSASQTLVREGKPPLPKAAVGRGQTLEPTRVTFRAAPIRKGRAGEMQPEFYGSSVKFAQAFKQARRLQSLVRAIRSSSHRQQHHLPSLWYRIRHAPGFNGGFCKWYCTEGTEHFRVPVAISFVVPSAEEAETIFLAVQSYVRAFEKQLIKDRVKDAKARRLKDLNYVFKDCQKDAPSKVELLVDTRQWEVVDIHPEDSAIIVEPGLDLIPQVPLCFQGKPLDPIHVDTDTVWLPDVSDFQIGDCIRQTRVMSDLPSIFDAFKSEWEPRWKRLHDVLPSQWDQISSFARRVLPQTQWQFRVWDEHSFLQAAKGKKRRAAVGPDGVSKKDIMALPSSVHQCFAQMYQDIERSSSWPLQLTIGIVSSLEKKPGAMLTFEYRPIVVYSLLYRLWSSFRARDFLKTFALLAPDGVRGGIPSRQAKSIWYEAALLLEQAQVDASPYVGIVADLSKAFNMIPREPVWLALDAMGVPHWFIRTWAAFVACQSRRFQIRSSVGPAMFSDVGYPEGCALSVCAMGIVDLLLDFWLRPVNPTIQVYSYVDDWQILHRALDQQDAILRSLWAFVDAVMMKIDKSKSFVWAVSAFDRKTLRQTSPVQVVLCAKELGAHLNFCKRSGNRSLLDRISGMAHTWTLLRASLSPYHHKLTALRMLAWPRSLYGISVVNVGPLNFGALRTGAMRGLKQDRVGSNPCLHLPLHGFTLDPEGFAILQTLKDAREHANRDAFRGLLSLYCHSPSCFPSNGPVGILVSRVSRLGWTLQLDGTFHDSLGRLDIFQAHIDELKHRIGLSWGWVLTAELSHRQDFCGLQHADLTAAHAILREFSSADQVYLRCSLDGTMVTQKDRHHFQEGNTGACGFCGATDSPDHRIWHCPKFVQQRNAFPRKFLPCLRDLPPCTLQHAWPFRPESYNRVACALNQIVDVSPADYKLPASIPAVIDLFCDGTCRFPESKPLRLSAWAVTMALPGFENELLAAGVVPGSHQSAFRAELLGFRHALALALKIQAKHTRVWCDCQSVVNTARKLQQNQLRLKPNSSHADLWEEVIRLLHLLDNSLVICQVYAHNQISSGLSEVEAWAYWHNSLTDIAAAKTNAKRPEVFWDCWCEAAADYKWHSELFLEIAKLHVSIGKQADSLTKATKPIQRKVEAPAEAKVVVQPRSYAITTTLIRKHGYNIVQLLYDWWVNTGAVFLNRAGPLHWISFTQLFVDFQLSTGHVGPTYRDLQWFEDDTCFSLDSLPHWGQHARWFQLLLKGFWHENGVQLDFKSGPPFSSSLQCWMVNARLPWCSDRLDVIDRALLDRCGVLRRGKDIHTIVHFSVDSRMAVPLTTRG